MRVPLYSGAVFCYGEEVSVPAIVDSVTYARACERRARGKELSPRNTKREYLLRGLITCSCGYKTSAIWKEREVRGKVYGYRRYKCGARNSGQQTCICQDKMPSIPADRFESVVWNWIAHEVLNEQHLLEAIDKRRASSERDRAHLDAQKVRLYTEKVGIQAELDRFYERYGKGKLTEDELDRLEAPRKAAMKGIDAELEKLDRQIAGLGLPEDDVVWLLAFAREIGVYARDETEDGSPSFVAKRRILELLGTTIKMVLVDGEPHADVTITLTEDFVRLTLTKDAGSMRDDCSKGVVLTRLLSE